MKISRRKLIKKIFYTGAAAGGAALLGKAGYSLLHRSSADELYGPYPEGLSDSPLKRSAGSAPRPNVIIIYCDDLGYNDLGCYGCKSILTPNIDKMASKGMLFTDFYACSAVCAPSRAGLLTGRYPFRTGITGNPYPADEPAGKKILHRLGSMFASLGISDMHESHGAVGLSPVELTLPEALKSAGYSTAMIGKWHLGDFSKDPQYNPTKHGFDRFLGVPHSNDLQPMPLYKNDAMLQADVPFSEMHRLTGMYTSEAVSVIEESGPRPFFLYLAHTFPHQPIYASEKFAGRSAGGKFGDAVEEIDWSMGEIISALRKKGIEKNTLILFTSDNGPWYEGSTGTLRGGKGQSFEGGFRVPFIAYWPGIIKGASVTSQMAANMDIFPTLLGLSGLELPEDRKIDGLDMTPLLTGRKAGAGRETFFFYHYNTLQGVRHGKWKYLRRINTYVWPVPLDQEKIIYKITSGVLGGNHPLLYDLEKDPGENYNLADRHPDIISMLEGLMQDWEKSVSRNPRGFSAVK